MEDGAWLRRLIKALSCLPPEVAAQQLTGLSKQLVTLLEMAESGAALREEQLLAHGVTLQVETSIPEILSAMRESWRAMYLQIRRMHRKRDGSSTTH